MHSEMTKGLVIIVCGIALLIAASVCALVFCERRQPSPPPEVPVATSPAEVLLKAVERKAETVK